MHILQHFPKCIYTQIDHSTSCDFPDFHPQSLKNVANTKFQSLKSLFQSITIILPARYEKGNISYKIETSALGGATFSNRGNVLEGFSGLKGRRLKQYAQNYLTF